MKGKEPVSLGTLFVKQILSQKYAIAYLLSMFQRNHNEEVNFISLSQNIIL